MAYPFSTFCNIRQLICNIRKKFLCGYLSKLQSPWWESLVELLRQFAEEIVFQFLGVAVQLVGVEALFFQDAVEVAEVGADVSGKIRLRNPLLVHHLGHHSADVDEHALLLLLLLFFFLFSFFFLFVLHG